MRTGLSDNKVFTHISLKLHVEHACVFKVHRCSYGLFKTITVCFIFLVLKSSGIQITGVTTITQFALKPQIVANWYYTNEEMTLISLIKKLSVCLWVFVQHFRDFVSLCYPQSTVVESCVCQSQDFNMELSGCLWCCGIKSWIRDVLITTITSCTFP